MTLRAALVARLADGQVHAAGELGRALELDAAALAAVVADLSTWQLTVAGDRDAGYRLAMPFEPLDAGRLRAALAPDTLVRADRIEVHGELVSTNAQLLASAPPAAGQFRASLAEFQSAGRGRRGRRWLAPYGSGLCLSFAWCFAAPPAALGALSLAAGVAVLRAFARHGIDDLALKWPNDIQRAGAKLGGILSELRVEPGGAAHVVVGVGLNVRLPAAAAAAILAEGGLPAADLSDLGPPSRTELAAALLDALVDVSVEFASQGFAAFAAEWSAADVLRDRPVRVHGAERVRDGIARGIDAHGGLRVEFSEGTEVLTAGDVSLRAAA
jgi:BirA family biotin operon repressor/biotin-[acetyl-CoA-carboxylase] ligase